VRYFTPPRFAGANPRDAPNALAIAQVRRKSRRTRASPLKLEHPEAHPRVAPATPVAQRLRVTLGNCAWPRIRCL
jgi:hypothetical protein